MSVAHSASYMDTDVRTTVYVLYAYIDACSKILNENVAVWRGVVCLQPLTAMCMLVRLLKGYGPKGCLLLTNEKRRLLALNLL